MAGTESETLTVNQIPAHSHGLLASSAIGGLPTPESNVLAKLTNVDLYSGDTTDTPMSNVAVDPAGGSQPHENTQPFLCINFIISLFGVFPSQT